MSAGRIYQPLRGLSGGFWMIDAWLETGDSIGRGAYRRQLAPRVCLNLGITRWKPILRIEYDHHETGQAT